MEGDDANDGENKENGKCIQIIRKYWIFIQISKSLKIIYSNLH